MTVFARATSSQNNSETVENKLEDSKVEVENLHHLLNGYNSILYRFKAANGKKLIKIFGRPDRIRNKYSTNEAIVKLHHIDDIFPIYQNYFNVTVAEDSASLEEILSERVQNIENTLRNLEDEIRSCGCRKLVKITGFTFLLVVKCLIIGSLKYC